MKYRGLEFQTDLEVGEQVIKHFIDHRIAMKKPLTTYALGLQIEESKRAHEVGMSPEELIIYTIKKTWQGINIVYTAKALADEQRAVMETYATPANTTRSMTLQDELSTDWAKH